MNFTIWLENRKKLAQTYKSALSGVPQDPIHHPEGDTITHVRLVRKAIPKAIQELKQLQADPNFSAALSNIDFNISPQEEQLLALSAWLHDIGKATATTIGGQPWTVPGATGKIQAIGHQDSEHYLPQLEKLKDIAPPETVQLYLQNKDLINFIIEHHMDFTSGVGFAKGFLAQYFHNGVINNSPEMKLLLILMWADKMGRKPEETIAKVIGKNVSNLATSIERSRAKHANSQNQSTSFSGSPEEFSKILKSRSMTKSQRIQALKGKYPYLSDDELATLTEGFRNFLEASQMNPTIIPANIPIDQNVLLLSQVLKQHNPKVEVYAVGGAVRDFLFHKFNGGQGSYKPKDVDLTTNLSEEEILQRLRSSIAIQHGIKVKEKESVDTFGVVFASVKGSETYEIAPFRKDIGVSDGRRPDRVERGTIQDDAMRRDLTINNLYYDFEKGQILDFNEGGQGIEDIKNGVARPVGDPFERFNEDKLRILRLVRFFSRFNSGNIIDKLDSRTAAAIRQYGNLREQGISPERIQTEFVGGINQSLNTASFLNNLVQLETQNGNLMNQVFPGLKVDIQGINRLGNLKNIKVILAWLLRGNEKVENALLNLKYPYSIFGPVKFLIDAINLKPESVWTVIKNRDKGLLKPNAISPGGSPYASHEIESQNKEMVFVNQKDLNDLARVAGDPALAKKLMHFSSYQPPVIDSQELMQRGLKGPQIGDEQKKIAAAHYHNSFQNFNAPLDNM